MPITNSANFKATVAPILSEPFDGLYKTNREYAPVFRSVEGTPRNQHVEPLIYGFGTAPDLGDGQPVTYDQSGELFTQNYFYRRVGLAFALTETLVDDDDHIQIGRMMSEHLGKSMLEAEEIKAANVLNRGFNAAYVGGDGSPLFASNHLGYGSTFSNLITGTMSQTTLEQILQNIRNAIDARGKKIGLKGKNLVVPPALMMQARVLLKSALRTGTGNNDINPTSGDLGDEPVVMSRLTSSTAWFVTTDAPRGLQFVWRHKVRNSMEGDFETNSMRYKAIARYAVGWTDPRGAWGSAGT